MGGKIKYLVLSLSLICALGLGAEVIKSVPSTLSNENAYVSEVLLNDLQ